MVGNVWQWTGSDYDDDTKEIRGGSFNYGTQYLRASLRNVDDSVRRSGFLLGVRCALNEGHDGMVELKPGEQVALKRETANTPAPTESSGATFRAANLEWQTKPDQVMDWEAAKSYCARLSLAGGGWRLPSKEELLALVHSDTPTPYIYCRRCEYWSSSSPDGSIAWFVSSLSGGYADYSTVTMTRGVRCVR